MLLRDAYKDGHDEATLTLLQDILEYVWLAIVDGDICSGVTRESVARRIIAAHEAGLTPEAIKNRVILEITQTSPARQQELPRSCR
jgi:hypothetical protein